MNRMDHIREIIDDSNSSSFLLHIEDNHESDIADILYELDDDQLIKAISWLPDEILAATLAQAPGNLQRQILGLLHEDRYLKLLSHLEPDDVADLLGEMPVGIRKRTLDHMKKDDSKLLKELLHYDKDSAGGRMTTKYIALRGGITIGKALNKIREIGAKTEFIENLFIVDEAGKLIGKVDIRDILNGEYQTLLEDIMEENVVYVEATDDQEEVALIAAKYDLRAIPVVNQYRAIVGIITLDDIIDIIQQEHTEDVLKMGGVSADETYDSNVFRSIRKRFPWLLVNLVTATIASSMVTVFEGVIGEVVALAAAMPIVAGLGGNTGSQTLAVIIRSLALGKISLEEDYTYVFKEALIGILSGLLIGIVSGALIYLRYQNLALSLIMILAMMINLMIASIFGFLIPLILKKIGVDPAVSSSIFLTGITDTCGFFVFLGLASIFLPYLVK